MSRKKMCYFGGHCKNLVATFPKTAFSLFYVDKVADSRAAASIDIKRAAEQKFLFHNMIWLHYVTYIQCSFQLLKLSDKNKDK